MAGRNGISINWNGLRDSIERGTANIANTQQLMMEIGAEMKRQTVKRFHESVDPEGNAWAEVKHPRKDSQGRPRRGRAKPLLDTGRLRNSLSYSATSLEVHMGSDLIYARIHQLGGPAGRGRRVTIPARPYLGLSEEDQQKISDLVKDHLEGSFE